MGPLNVISINVPKYPFHYHKWSKRHAILPARQITIWYTCRVCHKKAQVAPLMTHRLRTSRKCRGDTGPIDSTQLHT